MPLVAQNPGKLDRRVTLRYPTISRDSVGAAIENWADLDPVWAGWLPQGGREFYSVQARHAEATGVFRLRYRSDLAPTWRIVEGDVLYEALAVSEVGRRNFVDVAVRALDQEVDSAAVKAGVETLSAADESKAVVFASAFSAAPRGISVTVLAPNGGYVISATVDESTRTAAGFTAVFGAAIPASGYKLSWTAVL